MKTYLRFSRGASPRRWAGLILVLMMIPLVAACGSEPAEPSAGPPGEGAGAPAGSPSGAGVNAPASPSSPGEDAPAHEPAAGDWPREVTDAFGETVVIPAKPERIITLSLGLDEIVMALAGPERFAAISDVARSAYSNVADLAAQVPETVTADLEHVLGLQPDLLLLDNFAQPDLVVQARAAGLTIVVTDLHDSFEEHLENLDFLGRVLGEEAQAAVVREMLEHRAADLAQRIEAARQSRGGSAPRVLHLTPSLHVPADGTTSEDIIVRAGGVNVATEAGLEGWQQISLETIAELNPEVIIYDEFDADRLRTETLEHPSLAGVPAIRDGRAYEIPSRYLSTLSFWNLRGAEELARYLWPEAFEGVVLADFTFGFE